MMKLSKKVKALRQSRGLNQTEFAKLVGNVDQSTVSKWERDKQQPRGEALVRLAGLAEKSPAEFMGLEQSGPISDPAPSPTGETEDKGFGEVKQAEFSQESGKPGGAATHRTSPSKAVRRSPLFGSMKGTTIIMPGVDLTKPADPEWGRVYDDDYDHGVVLEPLDRKQN